MEYIRVTKENLEKEHICCAIANNKDIQVSSKKAWLEKRFEDGLVFLKSVERGKCFIEYIPSENAWIPLNAEGWMYIDCLWVSGSFKGHGYSTDLLDSCLLDSKAKGKKGLCILSSRKKLPFLADPKFLLHKGFQPGDECANGIQLWYLAFEGTTDTPSFKGCARTLHVESKGITIFHTHQCPYTAKYVPILGQLAEAHGIPFQEVLLKTKDEAQNAPTPVTSYALFFNGEYLTNEIFSEKKFLATFGS